MSIDQLDREILLDGSANFRDLGGLRTEDGQTVRARHLFRSDALHALTVTDLERIAHLRIATLIDLRSPAELARSGPSPLVAQGTRHLHWPIFSNDVAVSDLPDSLTLHEHYIQMLEHSTDRLRELFATLAAADSYPAVIHCAAGKDRTGVVTALVLRTLGVPHETIVADYALTDRNMARVIARLQADGQPITALRVPAHFLRAVPETMTRFLSTMDEQFGSIERYLTHAEIPDDVITAVRRQLLAPAA